jgi:hypothetical protein
MGRGTKSTLAITLSVALLSFGRPVFSADDACPPAKVATGARVRLSSPLLGPGWVTGSVSTVEEEALSVTIPTEPSAVRRVPWCSITKLEVSRGTYRSKQNGTITGLFMLGVPLGALLGWVFVGATALGCEEQPDCSLWGPAALGAGLGLGLGAAVGAAVSRGEVKERWELVVGKHARLSVRLGPGRLAAGLSVGF